MYAYLCVLLIAVGCCLAGRVNNRVEHQNHLQTVQEFRCKEPQQRAVHVSALREVLAKDSYYPPMTVVRRCDSGTGCCLQEGQECGPVQTVESKRTFLVKTLLPGNKVTTGRGRLEVILVEEHTECGCIGISDLPK